MGMSKKDYQRIAALLQMNLTIAASHPNASAATTASVENVARGLADLFAQDNPRFDKRRFLSAAGVESDGRMIGSFSAKGPFGPSQPIYAEA